MRLRERQWELLDRCCAAGFSVPAGLVLLNEVTGPGDAWVVPVALAACVLPVATRRRSPVLAMLVVLAGTATVGLLLPAAVVVGLLPLSWVLSTVALTQPGRVVLLCTAGALAAAAGTGLPDGQRLGASSTFGLLYVLVATGSWAVAAQRRATRSLADLQREQARRAAAQERLLIARELHDVVAHGISVITVQASFAALVLDTRPDRAAAALAAIETTGRRTLQELRWLLGVLRDEPPGAGELAPAPGLTDLGRLFEQTAEAGVQVALHATGRPRVLPPTIELTGYRIVQEALTNVVRHADAAHARVELHYGEHELDLAVIDRGRGCPGPTARRPGHGLTGIRERAELIGGACVAGSVPAGGFEVRVRLPVGLDDGPCPE